MEKDRTYFDFNYSRGVFKRLIDGFGSIDTSTVRNRELRYLRDIDSVELRDSGILRADELYIKSRLIDTNIRREQPQYLAYLTQSRRAAVFTSDGVTQPDGVDRLETNFTRVARYNGWERPFIRVVDGAQLHGWDFVEVVYDNTKPGHFSVEHVGRENLILSTETENLEVQEVILRKYKVTSYQLDEYVAEFGFDADEVNTFKTSNKETSKGNEETVHTIYKATFRENGVINVGWFSDKCSNWFKEPLPLFLGRRDVLSPQEPENPEDPQSILDYPPEFETEYPYYMLPYVESEDPMLTRLLGRAELDEPLQEAVSALNSCLVNGTLRASNIYGSPQSSPANSSPNAAPKQTDIVLKNGAIYDLPMSFFHTPYPDKSLMDSIKGLTQQNSAEQSHINYTVLNRADSGKTATEIDAAQSESAKLSSVQVTLLSIFIRNVYTRCWKIYQSCVARRVISVSPDLFPMFVDVTPVTPIQPQQVTALKQYTILSAGDIDVIKRAEKLTKQQQAWPVFSQTPIAGLFLRDIIRNAFPEEAERYIAALDQNDQQKQQQMVQLVSKLGTIVKNLAMDDTGQLRPELHGMEPQLQQLAQQVAQVTQPQGQNNEPAAQQ